MSGVKRLIAITSCLLLTLLSACSGNSSTQTQEKNVPAQVEIQKYFDETVAIFKGYEEIVVKFKDKPSDGAKACKKYVEEQIPNIKANEVKIKELESSGNYIKLMMNTNNEIKSISDKVTTVATDNYGLDGADVLMYLADMALARL